MIFEIPLSTTSEAYSIDIELDGSTYALDFTYSRRSSLWYLDIYFLDNGARVAVSLGIAVLSGYPLLASVVGPRRPLGELQVQCDGRDPGRDDLGSFARLFYYDAAEFKA